MDISNDNVAQKLQTAAPTILQETKQTKKKATAKSKTASQSILKNNVINQNGVQDLNKVCVFVIKTIFF